MVATLTAGPGVGTPREPAVSVPPFDLDTYLADLDPDLLAEPEGRRLLTRTDPLLFALLYFPHHLTSPETGGRITLCSFHLDLCESAQQWIRTDLGPAELREAWVAPRHAGKSTWTFLILPLWALAHGHRRFMAAFADSAEQAQTHLASLKRELDTNQLLRTDYPDLCQPAKRQAGTSVSDNRALYVAASGAAIMAKGIDSTTLGAKVGNQRPDLLLFDDIEPPASNYSPGQKESRLRTVVDAVFPMSLSAVVLFAGTVTMSGSIIHDIVRQVTRPTEAPEWTREENIRARYYAPILTDDDGTERSLWPERWSLEYLQSKRHTRSYRLNFLNDPMGADGSYWQDDDFHHATLGGRATRWLLQVDPAVTTKGSSDWTGLAVVGYMPPTADPSGLPPTLHDRAAAGLVEVAHAEQVKLVGEPMRRRVLALLARYPRIKAVRVEVNQGGDLWRTILHDLPVRLLVHTVSASKEVRFAEGLDYYQRRQVVHTEPLPLAEEQMVGFPRMPHDDVADAVVGGVLYFLARPAPSRRVTLTAQSYV